MKMTREEMVKLTKEVFELSTLSEAKEKLKSFEEALIGKLEQGDEFKFMEVTFTTVDKPESKGSSPIGGDWVKPAHTAVKTKIGKALKDRISGL